MLNYKQLYYFWHVARCGSVTQAAEQLHLTPQTISGQVAELEQSLGVALFNRVGRRRRGWWGRCRQLRKMALITSQT